MTSQEFVDLPLREECVWIVNHSNLQWSFGYTPDADFKGSAKNAISIYRFVQNVAEQPGCLVCVQSSWNNAIIQRVAQQVMMWPHCSNV